MHLNVICRETRAHINVKNLKKLAKKSKNVVDRKVLLRYNVTRWRQMRFGAFKVTYEPVKSRII